MCRHKNKVRVGWDCIDSEKISQRFVQIDREKETRCGSVVLLCTWVVFSLSLPSSINTVLLHVFCQSIPSNDSGHDECFTPGSVCSAGRTNSLFAFLNPRKARRRARVCVVFCCECLLSRLGGSSTLGEAFDGEYYHKPCGRCQLTLGLRTSGQRNEKSVLFFSPPP